MTATRFGYDPRGGRYLAGPDFGLPRPEPAPELDDAELELLVRFEHPAKLLAVGEMPGAGRLTDAAVAEAYAIAPTRLLVLRAGLRAQAREAATRMLEDLAVRTAVRALPVPVGGVLIALGDSITDDLLSWAELLRHCLACERPDDGIVVVNAGVSGDTTSDALRRMHGVVAAQPDLVVTMLGTNDCQRHGPAAQRIVPERGTRENLRAIAGWLRDAGAEIAWLTPPPVDETALAAAVGDRAFSLLDADARSIGGMLGELGGHVVDVHALLRDDPAMLLLADGVHPSLAGQVRIASALTTALGQPVTRSAPPASR